MRTKNKLLITLSVFLILFVLIGSVSAVDDNTATLSQGTDKEINQDEISTGNPDSSLLLKSNDENTILKASVENRTFAAIQDAIDKASSGDTIELMGEYNGSGEEITIETDNLKIIGKEGATLDAQDQSRILNIKAKGVILKDITFKSGSVREYGGAVCIKDDANVTFINCVFEGNNAEDYGGAVYVDENAEVSFTNCSFTNNSMDEGYGVAVYMDTDAAVSFTNCSFDKNTARYSGGAVYGVHNDAVSFTNCSFTNNYVTIGGIVDLDAVKDTTVSFTNCSFINNNECCAIYIEYGKINITNCSFIQTTSSRDCPLLQTEYSRGSLTNCLFDKNSVDYMILAQYGALNLTNCSFTNNAVFRTAYFSLTEEYNLINCSFTNNSGDAGVAVFIDGENEGMANFINCSFNNNDGNNEGEHAKNEGGAVCICNTGASFTNCSFDNNSIVQEGGGAVYIHETYSTYFKNCSFTNNKGPNGGAVFVENDGANFTGCSFTNNNANTGGAVFVEKDGANFTDCLFYNNTVDQQGGAVFIGGSVESSFNNCSFTNNNASTGGAIYNKNDKTLIKGSKFIENKATVGQAIKTEKDMTISDSEFRNGKYCIDVKLGAKVTLDNVLSDDPPLINEIFMKILEAKDVVYGNNVSIKVQVNSSATTLLNIGKVVVKINNVEYKSDVKNGIATLVIPKLNAGPYNVNVRYDDNNEPKAETPVNFTVKKASAEIIIANDTLNVQVSDLISAGATLNPAEAGKLTYNSNNSDVAIVENNTIKALSIGTAVITVGSTGNNNYDVADEKNITVNVGARIWYVDDDADPDGDGRSKETAFKTFQDALDVAGHDDIIMIAEGSYSYGRNVDLTINTENLTIMKYGDGEAIFDAHEECTIWDCGVNVNIIGLTFKGARSQTIGDSQGGALNLAGMDNDNVHVKDCKFINNAASYGGAMFIYSGTVTNCTFIGNNADSNGGAVFMQYGTITTCTFINNTSPHGGAICCGEMKGIVADTCIFKSGSDKTVRVNKYPPTMNGDVFTTVYNSGEKLTFDLKTHGGMPVDDGIISMKLYNKSNDVNIANYTCISGEGWTVDLPVGNYYAILNTEYAKFKPVSRIINVLPDVEYYVTVIPTTSNNLTVDIIAKSNIPQDIVEGELQFILPNGTAIDAILIQDGEWWAQYTFDDYGDYLIGASYTGLSNVTINNDTIIISTKPKSSVNITDVVLDYGEGKNITVNTTGAAGITAKINDVDVKVDGFTIEIPVMDAGDYTLRVTTIPYDDYSSVTELVTITVNKVPTEIVIANATLNVSMVDFISTGASLSPADAGNLTYTSSNSSIVVVENGKIKPIGVGTAVITVSFGGNDDYMAAENKTITVNVGLSNASVSVNNSTLDLFVDNTFTLVAVTDPAGLNVTYVPDDSGVVSVTGDGVVTALKEGTAKITVNVGGDGVYAENSTTVTVTVNKVPTEINIANSTVALKVNDEVVSGATLTPADAGNLTYTSSNPGVAVVENGKIKGISQGVANITVSFAGDGKYDAAVNKTIAVSVSLADASVKVNNYTLDLKIGDTFVINATTLPEGLYVTYVQDDSGVYSVDENGVVTALTNGTGSILVKVGGDGVYAENSTTVTVTVTKIPTEIRIQNDTLDMVIGDVVDPVVSLMPSDAGNMSFTVSDENIVLVNGHGVVKAVGEGNATVTVRFGGNDKYLPSNATITVTVRDALIVTAPDVVKYYGGPERFVVNVTDSKGTPLSNKSVTIVINKVTYNRTTDENGIASIGLNLHSGTYNATVTVDNKTVNSVVNVLTTVNGTDVVKMYKNDTQYYATFVDSEGKYLADGTVVKFNINGVMYERKISGGKGQAKLNINLPAGKYVITATNPKTKEMESNKITVLSNIVENYDLIKYYKNASQYSLRLLDDKGNPVGAGVSVQLNINGVFYTRTSDANGYVKMNINLPPGTYIITAEYKGLKASNTIKVLSVLETKDLVMKYRDGSKFEAKILDGQGKPYAGQTVKFNINGVIYTKTTGNDGIARLNINLLPGQYIITSTYNGLNAANKVTISG